MLKKIFSPGILEEVCLEGTIFKVKHSLRKNMRRIILRVENKNELRLSSSKISKKRLLSFINEHKSWILNQQDEIKDEFSLESKFYFLAKPYHLKHDTKALYIREEYVYINPVLAKMQSDNFYKKHAKKYLPERVKLWQEKMNLDFNRLSFRLAKKRWGSCNSKRNISLNPYMMKLSYEMIDYIIVHELSHLVHLNHSPAFYKTIEQYIPQYKAIEKEIKSLSVRLN
ncbi:M48 family metallopeptidase [Sulfurimonas sp. MAG313]|nr:SprT family zinc-dependent metalloprotease [Sulfurimonas sp. MAG313]MDF1880455.1 M48 family metallopeptidase [Sulfurimonas sp. MAG313]